MVDDILIRKAVDSDVEEIWELLRAEREMWSTERILAGIDGFFVVIYKRNIVCVINGVFIPGKSRINWVAVHPMLPESSVSIAMVYCLWGIIYRKPVNDINYALHSDNMEGVINEIQSGQRFRVSNLSAIEGTD